MTVRELREALMKFPDEAVVFEEREGELRELREADVSTSESADGHPIDSAEYDDEDWERLMGSPIVILGAWS